MDDAWSCGGASVAGTSHLATGKPCQDASGFEVVELEFSGCLVAVVADGAGSASCSDQGSSIACEFFLSKIRAALLSGRRVSDLDFAFFSALLHDLVQKLSEVALAREAELREFATTILAAVIDDEVAVFFQIGDGAMVVADPDDANDFSWIFWPDQGEYANNTTFVTGENAKEAAQFSRVDGKLGEVALFTDGLQRLALHIASKTAHSPFFNMVFTPLRKHPGTSEETSGAVERFLRSEAICERTDDDKTLVLARRQEPPTRPE